MKVRARLRLDGPIRTTVPPVVASDLLAVLSEALTNVGRHARASSVEVRVAVRADTLEMSVSDDGCGISDDGLLSGLHNMRERAESHGGELEVRTGAGTTVTWRVPLDR
jgi:signal transduction histidine kinase